MMGNVSKLRLSFGCEGAPNRFVVLPALRIPIIKVEYKREHYIDDSGPLTYMHRYSIMHAAVTIPHIDVSIFRMSNQDSKLAATCACLPYESDRCVYFYIYIYIYIRD
jgi:hypothetical protein